MSKIELRDGESGKKAAPKPGEAGGGPAPNSVAALHSAALNQPVQKPRLAYLRSQQANATQILT